ncbi:MAG: hypothetical protein M3Z26_09820 [Bacteroidota bacterium]|nr:hypothetical protein [Bacteroidota bacterium]
MVLMILYLYQILKKQNFYNLQGQELIMKKYLFLIIFCCANNFLIVSAVNNPFDKLTESDPVRKIAKEIAKSNVYEYPAASGISVAVGEQNIHYDELLKIATTEDLSKLAKHKNAVVRLYAYRAIVQKSKEIPKDIFEQFSNDTSIVNTLRGNISGTTSVNKIAESFLY